MRGRKKTPGRKLGVQIGVATAALGAFTATAGAIDQAQVPARVHTTTPIKHVIVVIAENSSFDHSFGTFRPRHGQTIHNLLSTGIVNEDGTPGPNAKKAAQFTVTPQPHYFISAPAISKTPYTTLPPPDLNGVPQASSDTHAPPFATTAAAAAAEPVLAPKNDVLLTTGASGLPCVNRHQPGAKSDQRGDGQCNDATGMNLHRVSPGMWAADAYGATFGVLSADCPTERFVCQEPDVCATGAD